VAPDDYEKNYMGGGEALARSRAGMPWWFHALLAIACITTAGTAFAHGALGAIISLPVLLLVWLLFMFVRVTVTPDTVHVQLGVFGPKIAITDIVEVCAEKYPVMKYGGWGIRFAMDGSVAYSVPGHGGRGVRIRYKKKNGREATAWVTSPEPESLVAAIEHARASKALRIAESVRVSSAIVPTEEIDDVEGNEEKRARR
jgi:hypothetical protein